MWQAQPPGPQDTMLRRWMCVVQHRSVSETLVNIVTGGTGIVLSVPCLPLGGVPGQYLFSDRGVRLLKWHLHEMTINDHE